MNRLNCFMQDAASPAAKPENDCQTLKNAELTSIPDSSEPQRPLATENDSDSDQDLLPDQSVSPCEPAAQATSVPLGSGDPGAETLPVNGPERGSALGVWQQLDNQHANSKARVCSASMTFITHQDIHASARLSARDLSVERAAFRSPKLSALTSVLLPTPSILTGC